MNIYTSRVALAIKSLLAVSRADINELRFCLCRTSARWKLLSIIQLTMEHSLFISTKCSPLNSVSYSRTAHSSALLSWWSKNPVLSSLPGCFCLQKVTRVPPHSRCGICSLYSGWLLEELDRYFINPPDWPHGRELQRAGLHSRSWRHQRAEPERTRCHLHEPGWAAESGAAELCSRYWREENLWPTAWGVYLRNTLGMA